MTLNADLIRPMHAHAGHEHSTPDYTATSHNSRQRPHLCVLFISWSGLAKPRLNGCLELLYMSKDLCGTSYRFSMLPTNSGAFILMRREPLPAKSERLLHAAESCPCRHSIAVARVSSFSRTPRPSQVGRGMQVCMQAFKSLSTPLCCRECEHRRLKQGLDGLEDSVHVTCYKHQTDTSQV